MKNSPSIEALLATRAKHDAGEGTKEQRMEARAAYYAALDAYYAA